MSDILPERISIEGYTHKDMTVEKVPASCEFRPRDPHLVPAANRSVVVNPSRTCMPLGAIWAVMGLNRAIPFVQGAQGCTTYVRYTFARIFREPGSVATASFHEDAAVFGGRRNVVDGLRNLVVRYWPSVIGVVTTCSSEIIGDDMENFIKAAKKKLREEIGDERADGIEIVLINTPSFVGSQVEGYNRAAQSFVGSISRKTGKPSGKVNIIPGMIYPGDIREIKYILREMGIEPTVLFDISDTLDAPLHPPKSLPYYPAGGTTIEEIRGMGDATATFAIQTSAGEAGARLLEKKCGVQYLPGPMPVGVAHTDAFVTAVAQATGREIPRSVIDDRGRLVDTMADTLHYTMMGKVAVFGDPDTVIGLTRFVCELGMTPVAVMTGTGTKTFEDNINAILEEYRDIFVEEPKVFNNGDLFEFEEYLRGVKKLNLIIGHSKGVDIAAECGVPLIRAGFPIYDRFGYQKKSIVGYRGSELLLYEIVNTIMGHHYPAAQLEQ
jgi:Nitrogenase molybdenum-iron protein, alpha and beta chains